jgi:hypothetical protein
MIDSDDNPRMECRERPPRRRFLGLLAGLCGGFGALVLTRGLPGGVALAPGPARGAEPVRQRERSLLEADLYGPHNLAG